MIQFIVVSSFFLQDYISFIFLLVFFFVVFSFGVVVVLIFDEKTTMKKTGPTRREKEGILEEEALKRWYVPTCSVRLEDKTGCVGTGRVNDLFFSHTELPGIDRARSFTPRKSYVSRRTRSIPRSSVARAAEHNMRRQVSWKSVSFWSAATCFFLLLGSLYHCLISPGC